MPPLPTYRSQVTPSGRRTAEFISPAAGRTGAGQLGAGLVGLGRGITEGATALARIERDKLDIKVDREYTKGKVLLAEADLEFIEGLSRDSIPEGVEDIDRYFADRIEQHRKARGKILIDIGTTNESIMALEKYRTMSDVALQESAGRISWDRILDYSKFSLDEAVQKHLQLGQIAEAESAIIRQKEVGVLGDEESQQMLDNLPFRVARIRMDTDPQGAIEDLQAMKGLSAKDLETKDFLINKAKNKLKASQDKAVIAQEAYLNETHKLTMDALALDINDLSAIEKLPVNLKRYWEAKITHRNKMIKAGKGDPFVNVYDPAMYNSLRTVMEQTPKDLKESLIVDAVGRGLTLEQGIDLVERHRRLLRKDSPLTVPEAKRGVKRITNAFKAGIIKHPDFIEGAVPGSEDEYQNSLLRDRMIDEMEIWIAEKPRTHEDIRKYTTELLRPFEEMEGRNFLNQVFYNIFSREAWVFSGKDYRDAIGSLGKEAKKEWEHVGAGEIRHRLWGGVLAQDFIRKWQSPDKVLTPQVARIYLKWAHGDLEEAQAMAAKDGWRE